MTVRGLLSLHARFGRLNLAQVTVPAENLARAVLQAVPVD